MDEETKAEADDEARPADEVSAETAATTEPSTPAVEPAPTVPATEPSTAVVEPVAEPGPGRPRRHRVRRVATAVLVVLTALFTLFSVIGVWVHRSVYNEGEFTSIVTPVSEDPQVLDPLATYLTVQAIEALGLQDRVNSTLQAIGAALPGGVGDRLGALAAPLTTAAQEFVRGKVQDYLHSDEFRQTFSRLVTTVHQKLIALIKGDYAQLPNLQTGGPTVYLNTIPIVAQILRHVAQSAVDLVGLNVTVPEIPTGIVPD